MTTIPVDVAGLKRTPTSPTAANQAGWAQLVGVVQQLSMARSLARVMEIVRHAARELTGADGATFVLEERGHCFYADEDAIAPLWKGRRFPMSACVSGWVMRNREAVTIPDIYADPRVPSEAYRPTFVKSMAMVPIRTEAPLGAIGNYWARPVHPTEEQVALLQALADTTSVAIENVTLYSELEQRVKDRTRELEVANRELEAFSSSVSHDLRAPLRAISGFASLIREQHGSGLDAEGDRLLGRILGAGERMEVLIESLLMLARLSRARVEREPIDVSALAEEIITNLRATEPKREVEVSIAPAMVADGDPVLVRAALENLLSNAWKYTGKVGAARIELGRQAGTPPVYFVRDNGAGFDMADADELFEPFHRLHAPSEFPGTGIGLATVQRVVNRHGGRIWAESQRGQGATFFFTLAP